MNKNAIIGLLSVLVIGLAVFSVKDEITSFVEQFNNSGSSSLTPSKTADKNIEVIKSKIVRISQETSKLYIKTISATQSLHYESERVFDILNDELRFGKRAISIKYNVEYKAYVDLSKFDSNCVTIIGENVHATLPSIKMEDFGFEVTDIVEDISWNRFSFTEDERQKLIQEGAKEIKANMKAYITKEDVLEDAKVNAVKFFVGILREMGYKEENIDVNFSESFWNFISK